MPLPPIGDPTNRLQQPLTRCPIFHIDVPLCTQAGSPSRHAPLSSLRVRVEISQKIRVYLAKAERWVEVVVVPVGASQSKPISFPTTTTTPSPVSVYASPVEGCPPPPFRPRPRGRNLKGEGGTEVGGKTTCHLLFRLRSLYPPSSSRFPLLFSLRIFTGEKRWRIKREE